MSNKTAIFLLWGIVLTLVIFSSISSFALGALLSEKIEPIGTPITAGVLLLMPALFFMKIIIKVPNNYLYSTLLLPLMCFLFAFFMAKVDIQGIAIVALLLLMLLVWALLAKKIIRS